MLKLCYNYYIIINSMLGNVAEGDWVGAVMVGLSNVAGWEMLIFIS